MEGLGVSPGRMLRKLYMAPGHPAGSVNEKESDRKAPLLVTLANGPDTECDAAKCGREFLRERGSRFGGKLFLQLRRGLLR
jgi:hypothetical protein